MRIRFQDQIAGPRSGPARNGAFPALVALNSVSDVLGPGRLHNIKELILDLKWPVGGTQGEVTIEGSPDAAFTGTWAPLVVVPWSAANKIDEVRYSGSFMNIRARASVAIDGGTGVEITAQGNQ